MPDLVDSMKKAAIEAVDASKPCVPLFGTVTSVSPLTILVEQKLTLNAEQLVLSRNVTEFNVDVTINWQTDFRLGYHSHKIEDVETDSRSVGDHGSHSHSVEGDTKTVNLNHQHDVEGRKTMTVHNALKVGEKVLLFRMNGGQKYIVTDRVIA